MSGVGKPSKCLQSLSEVSVRKHGVSLLGQQEVLRVISHKVNNNKNNNNNIKIIGDIGYKNISISSRPDDVLITGTN